MALIFRYFSVFSIVFWSVTALAQRPAMQGMQGGGKMPAIGRIYGKVIDAASKQPVEYATITLLAMQKDSVITGALAQANGDFSLEKLPFGRFRLRIQFVGYKPLIQPVTVTPNNVEQDIGNIRVEQDTKNLKEVTVTAEKEVVTMGIDKRVYNPDKDLSAKGGTALDVMKNVPGVTVDADGNVALRNSSPIIFIDGRPSTLTLEQIPSDQIDRIEVITNPSAKYDASASGGILNVYLKKNSKPGYNGVVSAGVGTNNRYNLMTSLNIKEGKTNFFISYNLNSAKNPTKGFTDKTNLMNGEPTSFFNQNTRTVSGRVFQNGRLGFDYNISNRSMITLSQAVMFGDMTSDDNQTYTQTDANRALLFKGDRVNTQDNNFANYTSQIQFKKTFPQKGREWISDLNYNRSDRKTAALFTTNNYDNTGAYVSTDRQRNNGNGNSDMFTQQSDFTLPFSDTAKLEFGIKSNYKIDHTGSEVFNMNASTGEYENDSLLTSNYRIDNMINAAYVTYTNMLWGIGYQGGIRFEQTRFIGELTDKSQRFEYIYPEGTKNLKRAFFPSLYLSKKLSGNQEVQLNFSRKISRPDFMQVMPFIMFSDKLNYRIGNPALAPEFINLAEMNYNKIFSKGGSFLSSVYFKHIEDQITPYVYPLASDSNVLVSTFINGDNTWSSGWENNLKLVFFDRKLDLTLNGNIFYTRLSASTGTQVIKNDGLSWNIKAIGSYKLPKQYTVQVNGSYEAPRIIAQGETKPVYSIDLSLAKEIVKTLSVNLTLNDVFNTKRFGTYYETDAFTQDLSRRRETRFLRLTVTWRFGEMDTSLFRKKKANRDSQQNMEMDY
jgi:iron complex outermembrane receptor protein